MALTHPALLSVFVLRPTTTAGRRTFQPSRLPGVLGRTVPIRGWVILRQPEQRHVLVAKHHVPAVRGHCIVAEPQDHLVLRLSSLHGVQTEAQTKLVVNLPGVERYSVADRPRRRRDVVEEQHHDTEERAAARLQVSQIGITYSHSRHECRDLPKLLCGECDGMKAVIVGGVLFQTDEEVMEVATDVPTVTARKAILEGLYEERKREVDLGHDV